MTYKFAFSRPTATPLEEQALFAGYEGAGYQGLQLKWSQYTPFLNDPEAFLRCWGQHGGAASALITGGDLPDGDSKDQLRRLFAFASQVGTDLIVYCHGVSRKAVTREQIASFASVFEEMGKEAEQCGLRLSLHHHYDQPLMYREDFDIFFERVRNPAHVGLTVDTAHLVKSGIHDVAEVIRTFAPYINNFHMKDFEAGEYQILGRGEISFEPIFKAVRDIGYTGWVSADEESGGEVGTGMRECLDHMKSGLGVYGQ